MSRPTFRGFFLARMGALASAHQERDEIIAAFATIYRSSGK